MANETFSLRSSQNAAYHKALPKFPDFEKLLVSSTPRHRAAFKALNLAFDEWRKQTMNVLELGESTTVTPATSTGTGTGGTTPPPASGNKLSIGNVTSGPVAAASITGLPPNQFLNLVLPKGDKGLPGDDGDPGTKGQDAQQGWIRNITTNKLHQVLARLNASGDAEFYLSDPVNPEDATWPRVDGFRYWLNIGTNWYALWVRNNADGDAEPFMDDPVLCPDLYLTLFNINEDTTIKMRARNNVDGDAEPFLSVD